MATEWSVLLVFALATCLKILLVPSYKSTDFEVHRNWLAITHSLPLSKWYYEDTSVWTLDYPPFFAWFEWLLSQVAVRVDAAMVRVDNLGYSAWSCVVFQRGSVMVADLVLFYAVLQYCSHLRSKCGHASTTNRRILLLALLLLLNYGLIIVDHIHFQYNGMLFGLLLLSVTRIYQGRHLEGAFWFAVLLNFKHIFLYIAPAYFVYLLKHHCFSQGSLIVEKVSLKRFSLVRFISLAVLVLAVFVVSFGPFVAMGQLPQVISRLFPFKRGLCHAYWATNFWALYSVADKAAATLGSRLGVLTPSAEGSMTSGLVGEMQHQVLPAVPPLVTMGLTLAAILPALVRLWWSQSSPRSFLQSLVLCGFGSFMFGWHVHEKAIMMVTVPLCLLAVEDKMWSRVFILVSFAGHIALFPLLYQPTELLIKVTLFAVCAVLTCTGLPLCNSAPTPPTTDQAHPSPPPKPPALLPFLSVVEKLYIIALLAVQVYCLVLHGVVDVEGKYPFLPLLLTSVGCAVGVSWSWILLYNDFFFNHRQNGVKSHKE